MNDEQEELTEQLEDAEGEPTEGEGSPKPDDAPAWATQLMQGISALTEAVTKKPEPAPVAKEPSQEDTRSPWEIAAAEAEAQGIFSEEWKYQRALQLQDQRNREELKRTKDEIVSSIGGLLLPIQQDRVLKKVAGGDEAVAAEIQKMIDEGVVDAQGLQNESVARVVVNAAKQELAEKRQFHGAAPNGGNGSPMLNGLRASLNRDQLDEVKAAEKRYGIKFDDEMIAESFGFPMPTQRN